ncbi:hypothetical protein KJ966_10065 [bacterium]|nr:hypothetical protein [bacterium]
MRQLILAEIRFPEEQIIVDPALDLAGSQNSLQISGVIVVNRPIFQGSKNSLFHVSEGIVDIVVPLQQNPIM